MKGGALIGAGLLLVAANIFMAPSSSASGSKQSSGDEAAQVRYAETIALEQTSLRKTHVLLHDKLELREAEMKRRLRAIYKLSRANWPRLWFEPEARRERARWLGAARRIAMRDVQEIDMLHHEIDLANRAEARLKEEASLVPSPSPRPRSLQWPLEDSKVVREYGEYDGPSHRVKLRSRGVLLKSEAGQFVAPVAPGRVRYRGPIRGLGSALIVEHEGLVSVVGNLRNIKVDVDETVNGKTILGEASGESVYLELRVVVGQRGQSIDPEPLLMTPL